MKKILFSIILFAIAGAASAQIGTGRYYLGGSFNYNYDEPGTTTQVTLPNSVLDNYTNYHITNFQISPDFGMFLSKNWTIGIQLGYTHISGTEINEYSTVSNPDVSTGSQEDTYSTNALGIGLHARYYWMLNDKVGIFPQFGATTSNNLQDFNAGTLSIGGNLNIVFFATPRLAINLGFGNLEYDLDYATKTYTFNAGLNTNIGFGINYYYGKTK